MTKLYKNKDWLYDQYWNQEKSMREIAEEYEVSYITILRWMKKLNIERRPISDSISIIWGKNKDVRYRNRDWLYEQYIIQKKSTKKIAKECNTQSGTILRWMDRYNIQTRTYSESITRELNPNWKGGKYKNPNGYIYIKKRDHPNANSHGYVAEHVLVMEKKLGRYLEKDEVIHHINFIPYDNRIQNLHLFENNSKHQKVKKSLFNIIKPLIKRGFIYFNKEKEEYELS